MYDFIRLQFAMGEITADQIKSCAAQWIANGWVTQQQIEDLIGGVSND